MAEFRYEAVDADGSAVRGRLQASDAAAARGILRSRALLPIRLDPVRAGLPERRMGSISILQRPMSSATLSRVTRQLSTLLANGIRVEDGLLTIARQGVTPKTAAILSEVRKQIMDGQGFAAALSNQGSSFPKPYVAAIAAGETSGRLDIVMEHLAAHTETAATNRQSILLALIYPAFLALVSASIIALLMVQVVPDILGVYQRRGSELPFATRVLIGISQGLESAWPFLLILAASGAAAGVWFVSTPSGNLALASRSLRVPVIGAFLRQKHAAQIASTLAILVGAGVPLVRALKVCAEVPGNVAVRNAIRAAASEVGDGASLDIALARMGILPPMMLSMIAGGIRSGELAAALAWTGRDEQAALDRKLKALTALVEPFILLLMGGIILFIVMAILTPITQLNALAGG